jgi:CheY-like chemotaxis protein
MADFRLVVRCPFFSSPDIPVLRWILNDLLVSSRNRLPDGVTSAASGIEGLRRFEQGHFDLVISDRTMPEMTGDELAAAIKERARSEGSVFALLNVCPRH